MNTLSPMDGWAEHWMPSNRHMLGTHYLHGFPHSCSSDSCQICHLHQSRQGIQSLQCSTETAAAAHECHWQHQHGHPYASQLTCRTTTQHLVATSCDAALLSTLSMHACLPIMLMKANVVAIAVTMRSRATSSLRLHITYRNLCRMACIRLRQLHLTTAPRAML